MIIWFELIFLSCVWFFQRFGVLDTKQSLLVTTYKISAVLLVFGVILTSIFLVILRERLKIINLMKKDIDSKGNNIINFGYMKVLLFNHTDHSRFSYSFLHQYNEILKSDLQLINF